MSQQFVRITKEGHPMRGMIGTITDTTEDGFERVTLLNSSFSAYFKPEDLQPLEDVFYLPQPGFAPIIAVVKHDVNLPRK